MKSFKHTCPACRYLRTTDGCDLYFCEGTVGGSWLARYGNEPEDYLSYPTQVLMQIERNTNRQLLKKAGVLDTLIHLAKDHPLWRPPYESR